MQNTQFAKAAVFAQRLPPAAAQASKFGIKMIDHTGTVQGNHFTLKQEGSYICNETGLENVGNGTIEPENEEPKKKYSLKRVYAEESVGGTGRKKKAKA